MVDQQRPLEEQICSHGATSFAYLAQKVSDPPKGGWYIMEFACRFIAF